jgi:hypothetical protein
MAVERADMIEQFRKHRVVAVEAFTPADTATTRGSVDEIASPGRALVRSR